MSNRRGRGAPEGERSPRQSERPLLARGGEEKEKGEREVGRPRTARQRARQPRSLRSPALAASTPGSATRAEGGRPSSQSSPFLYSFLSFSLLLKGDYVLAGKNFAFLCRAGSLQVAAMPVEPLQVRVPSTPALIPPQSHCLCCQVFI